MILDTLVTSGGVSGVHNGNKTGFRIAATELDALWDKDSINTVAIVTRHNNHASMVVSALEAGKHIFVEKPLALKLSEIDMIDNVFQKVNKERPDPLRLMVGVNRRFAPHIVKIKSLLEYIIT